MIIGQTLVATSKTAGSSSTTTVYSPWIASWGNSAIFSFEIIAIDGATPSFSVQVYTKNSESADPGTAKGSLNTQSTPGTYSITNATDLLELVRLEVKLTATMDEESGCCTAFCHFRILNPSWKTN
jgi:hypothetical protein